MLRLSPSYVLLFLLKWCLMGSDVSVGSFKVDSYEEIRNELLRRSEASHRSSPVIASTADRPFRLTYIFYLVDVIELDQINQLMTVLAYFEINWFDVGLSWNATDYGNTTDVLLETDSVWTPNILVLSGGKDSEFLKFNEELLVRSSGEVVAAVNSYVTFRCEIQFLKYPFDTQTCSFGLTLSTVHKKSHFDIHMGNITIYSKDYTKAGEWTMVGYEYSLYEDANALKFPRYTFVVKRQSVYYVITVVFPMVLTSVMIPMVFLIPTKTGEKISYLVTMFTSTAIFLSYISNVMPRNLCSLPYLAALLIEVMCEGLAAVLATLWVINMSDNTDHSETEPKELPEQIKEVDLKNANTDPKDGRRPERRQDVQAQQRRYLRRVDRCLFVLFICFQLVYMSVLFGATGWIQ